MRYVYEAVERIPKPLIPGVVYHNVEFELAALLCACGCGHRITLLVPDGHRISVNGDLPSITPSILVADAPCRSHYYVTDGKVDWWPAMSESQAAAVMRRQVARHVAADLAKRSGWERFRQRVLRAWRAAVRIITGST
jgi:hypothetical protein